ncbi:triosephosphate isomerase [Nitrosomonas cryotolerans]|uniref:Triosephosphate isomerase n=1 Tax=Nitrosomonas cryotolerans ATCC 49181 TaxID=1131553 RepID=A0A1N6GGF4_9PROT|nr:triose-phosphate isomerase [Nitrosomonas cryotolerans]SFP57372.1 triosephosphate isomerase [Nitrosomonas cryotolerans]SIO06502.1 triosephosphate isomerase [Nitrosomonas cryotolerans ATCC 49181]
MREKLVAGNWKMHGNQAENKSLLNAVVAGVAELRGKDIAVCAPYPYLSLVQTMLRDTNIVWGAQNVSQYDKGAYTGEISAAMLKDFDCSYVIVGHSERRALYNEDSHTVALKYVAVQREGMVPILCVGETLEQRESGITEKIISEQLDAVMNMAGGASLGKAVIAYEPVWAIGTGKTATPQQAQEVHEFIRARVAIQNAEEADNLVILYGGSVKANNAAELFNMPDIDGGLIGGASLVATEFISICQALQN